MTEGSLQREAAAARRRLGRVLVTGANGFIGAALVDRLRRDGEEVVASDLDRGGAASADFQGCDITDPRQVERLFARGPFDTTFHGGAISGPMVMRRPPARHLADQCAGNRTSARSRLHGSGGFAENRKSSVEFLRDRERDEPSARMARSSRQSAMSGWSRPARTVLASVSRRTTDIHSRRPARSRPILSRFQPDGC